MVSIVVCTCRRAEIVARVLDSLERQSHRGFEALIIGTDKVEEQRPPVEYSFPTRFLPSPKGLAPARNVGLRNAKGSIVCFLDDDVELETDFIERVHSFFDNPAMSDVGGLTGYDTVNYPHPISTRWKLRSMLGITPSLNPGDCSYLGRSVPFSFFQPFSGYRDVKWLPGFCQMFRASAIQGMYYSEHVIVEDREFSMRVGDHHRLVIWGDLKLAHRQDDEGRHSSWKQTWRAAFGLGYNFASRRRSWRDWLTIAHVFAGELIIDLLVLLRSPSIENVRVAVYRMKGHLSGLTSVRNTAKLEVR